MGLESATYIADLDAANPTATLDRVSQGDDQIRLIKSVILNSFPQITGAVTSSHTELNIADGLTATFAELNIADGLTVTKDELNYLSGVTSNVQTQLNAKKNALTIQAKTSSFTCAVNYRYVLRGSATSQTITLPASASQYDKVILHNTTSNTWLVDPGSVKINGTSGTTNINTKVTSEYTYIDSTTGWAFGYGVAYG